MCDLAPKVKVICQIMYFLVNAPKSLDVATSNFAAKYKKVGRMV